MVKCSGNFYLKFKEITDLCQARAGLRTDVINDIYLIFN